MNTKEIIKFGNELLYKDYSHEYLLKVYSQKEYVCGRCEKNLGLLGEDTSNCVLHLEPVTFLPLKEQEEILKECKEYAK